MQICSVYKDIIKVHGDFITFLRYFKAIEINLGTRSAIRGNTLQ